MAEHLTIPGALEWDAVERHSIATLRYAGGKEHDVRYVSEVAYDTALAREAALREELDRHKSLYCQLEKALSRVHCMYGKRLLDLTGERQTVLVPDEEFVKYFEELKCLKGENSALQQRLTVAEQRAGELEELLRKGQQFVEAWGDDSQEWMDLSSDISNAMPCYSIAALKPAAEGEGS